jgi:hypothetical protein
VIINSCGWSGWVTRAREKTRLQDFGRIWTSIGYYLVCAATVTSATAKDPTPRHLHLHLGLYSVKGSGLVDNNNKGAGTAPRNRTGRECLIVCLWGYATYLTVHSTLAHLDRGGIHPTTIGNYSRTSSLKACTRRAPQRNRYNLLPMPAPTLGLRGEGRPETVGW